MEKQNISQNNVENLNSQEAKDLKNIINNSAEQLIKDLSNIFSATKFDSSNITKGNIQLNESMDSMANRINTLLNVVNKMKIRELKAKKSAENFEDIIKKEEKLNKLEKIRKANIKYMEEIYQNINNTLVELKSSEFYLMSKKLFGK